MTLCGLCSDSKQVCGASCVPTVCNCQLLSRVRLFATSWAAAHQASLSFTSSRSLPKFMRQEVTGARKSWALMCTPTVFPKPERWEQPKRPSADKWINRTHSVPIVECYSVAKEMKSWGLLRHGRTSKTSPSVKCQTQKSIYYIISFYKMPRIGQSTDAESGLMVARGSGAGGSTAASVSDYRFFFFAGECWWNVLKLIMRMVAWHSIYWDD